MTKHYLGITAILALGLVVGCGDKEPEETGLEETGLEDTGDTDTTIEDTEFELLAAYLADNDLDLPTLLDEWVLDAQAVFDAGLESWFIIDTRTSDKDENGVTDYEDGHIPGAHMVSLADVVSYEAANNTDGLPVLVYCYTGQSAGHAVMALRLNDVDATSLKWGFSAWHSDFDLWTPNSGNAALDYPDGWSNDAAPDTPSFDTLPEIATGETDGAAIVTAQLDGRVLDEMNKIAAGDVLGAPDDYHVINFWSADDYDYYGHITGAYQVTPTDGINLDTLSMLPTDETIAIYCWSGQTSSMVAAWLQLLGYDAQSLAFGANTMILDSLEQKTFPGAMDFDYETGA